MGMVFEADVFRLTLSPLELELKNAVFNDRSSGERLFLIRDARFGLTVTDLLAWQLSRDISIETTEISGAEIWIRFDKDGRSNFSNIRLIDQEESRLNLRYSSMRLSLRDSLAHIGDESRSLSGDANNVQLSIEPEDLSVPEEQIRYRFDISSTGSRFVYDGRPLEEIGIRARGIADRNGAEVAELRIETPIGHSLLAGRIIDWASFAYSFDVESTVDLTRTATIFPIGAAVRGIGNFKGKVSGRGEEYRVEGRVDSESLTANGIYLRALDVEATVAGRNANYEANGRAVAELLTFEDFRIEFPRLAGNVRGTGTDFRWVGELQAAAARSGSIGLAGLFLNDAVAEMKDRELTMMVGQGRAGKFSIAEVEFSELLSRDVRIARSSNSLNISAPTASAATMTTPDFRLQGVTGKNLRVSDSGGRTTVELDALAAETGRLKDNRASDLRADSLTLTNRADGTDIRLTNIRARAVDAAGTRITDVSAPLVEIVDDDVYTRIFAGTLQIARIEGGGAVLGSLNIGGVRLTVREGRVEGTTDDIDAGDVVLSKNETLAEGGKLEQVKIIRPVFVVEPSGRYRASADMSIGGGIVGTIPLGSANAAVTVTNEHVDLSSITAEVMGGNVSGNATIVYAGNERSSIKADFKGLDPSKLIALQAGRIIPFEGVTDGRVELTFDRTDLKSMSGTVAADIRAAAGTDEKGRIPVNGRVELSADQGLFSVSLARFSSEKSELEATGRFDLRGSDSELAVNLRSADAGEVERIVRVLGVSPDLVKQLDELQFTAAGDLAFSGKLTGNITDPVIEGRGVISSISMRGRELGAVSSDIASSPEGVELRNGRLDDIGGGRAEFELSFPTAGSNNISVTATLTDVNAGNLLAALPVELPERLRDFDGKTSGRVAITGLPDRSQGTIDLSAANGTIAGQPFDGFRAKAVFDGTSIELNEAELRVGTGGVTASGRYDRSTTEFTADIRGSDVPLPLALSFLPESDAISSSAGLVNFTARAAGRADQTETYLVSFSGTARDVVVNENPFGEVRFKGETVDRVLLAELTATLDGRQQVFESLVDFGSESMTFRVEHDLDESPLRPFFALLPQLKGIKIGGTGTGRVEFGGNLYGLNEKGERVFSTRELSGTANFSRLSLQIEDTPVTATEPVVITFSPREITFESFRFAGAGSNATISGTKALTDEGINDLSLEGRVNLNLLNAFPAISSGDLFFGGFADISMRLAGPNRVARLSGTAIADNAAFSTFVGPSRITFDRMKGRVIFTANQAQVEQISGNLGGGRFAATGGVLFADNLRISSYRLALNGTNITVPLPEDFITTGDARLEVSGRRAGDDLTSLVSGSILARRSVYTRDIDLASLISGRSDASLSGGSSSRLAPRFDLTIEGRDALIVRNNVADLTASVALRLAGTTVNPRITGRITANSGTVFFRKDRYEVQRGVLEFPPNTSFEPVIFLQAETEIQGYQIFVNLSGPLTDAELLNATVRSSPALPQPDVVSLITTGSLSNTEAGIPTLASTGINTAAEVLTDSIINNPARRATDKLFGLNVFEIDPIISGERINPSARLTVGRQINNNLRVTYSTNLSQDQNQVLALEYRLSNRLAVVAQYEQRSLTNVTRDRDNFSFEIRFRRRF